MKNQETLGNRRFSNKETVFTGYKKFSEGDLVGGDLVGGDVDEMIDFERVK